MVTINTNLNIHFTHFVNIPKSKCMVATARENDSSKTQVYLIFHERNRIYKRNGLKGTWVEVDEVFKRLIRQLAQEAIDKNTPIYTTNSINLN